jgi:hypothetical protein
VAFEANNDDSSTLGNTSLDLFELNAKGSTTGGTYLGTFELSNSGDLSFQAVPEPSTYAMMVVGGLGFLGLLRRRPLKA